MDEKLVVGLKEVQARKSREIYGENTVEDKKRFVGIKILLSQFKSPLVYVLLFAAIVTFFLGEYIDSAVILFAVVINTILGFIQEYKAEKSLEALKSVLSPKAIVIRDGEKKEIQASEIVPGDVLILNDEYRVPADGLIIDEQGMFCIEAVLTGESVPVEKYDYSAKEHFSRVEEIRDSFDQISNKYKVHMGTQVKVGTARVLVVRTGKDTGIGKIATTLKETEVGLTPLQEQVEKLSKMLAIVVGSLATLVMIIGLLLGQELVEIFTTAVALAVSAIPEGLVVSLTVILAIGMQRILRRKAVVRRLAAAETLGSVSVICSDKTGTLTEGVMKVSRAVVNLLSDSGYSDDLVKAAILGNELKDPLEVGMSDWARGKLSKIKGSFKGVDDLKERYERVDILPFSAEDRYSVCLNKWGNKQKLFVTGAPEIVLKKCKMSDATRDRWLEKITAMAKKGYRLVGFSQKSVSGKKKALKADVKSMSWIGFLVYEDAVRAGVKSALHKVARAGVDVKVITGDFRETAVAVLREIGLLGENLDGLVLEGDEVAKMSNKKLREVIDRVVLFARTKPDQKLRIVQALKDHGHVVAMTGDGVNDAPALKMADIGIVVAQASDVSKETADMVMLESNFSNIVHAIEEGRGIYDNMKKIIVYLLADAFSEIIVVTVGMMLGWPLPLLAVQILWINLISDGFPGLALTIEPREGDVLKRKPRKRTDPLVDSEISILIVLISVVAAIMTLFAFGYFWHHPGYGLDHARTVAFAMLGVNSLFYVFTSRSLTSPIWKVNIFKNIWLIWAVMGGAMLQLLAVYVPPLQIVFRTVPLGLFEWGVVVAGSMVLMMIVEGVKFAYYGRN